MNKALKVVKIGNSAGVILPKDVLARLHAQPGGMVSLTATNDGVELTPFDPSFEAEMAVMRGVMDDYRQALRELAK